MSFRLLRQVVVVVADRKCRRREMEGRLRLVRMTQNACVRQLTERIQPGGVAGLFPALAGRIQQRIGWGGGFPPIPLARLEVDQRAR